MPCIDRYFFAAGAECQATNPGVQARIAAQCLTVGWVVEGQGTVRIATDDALAVRGEGRLVAMRVRGKKKWLFMDSRLIEEDGSP